MQEKSPENSNLNSKLNLKGRLPETLAGILAPRGHAPFRANQLFRWINQKNISDFQQMSDIQKDFRRELESDFELPRVKVAERHEAEDGTIKFVVELPDGSKVESVYIPTAERTTLCVSTQAGCKMACTFCATGYQKFTRNLEAWEIVDQLLSLDFPQPISNIVLMGMGEPFDNYENVVAALKIFQHPMGPQIGKRHITVSTVGLTPKMQEFIDENLGKLAISLHGTTDEQRSRLMPINRKHPLDELMETCRNLKFKNRDRVTFEYVLIQGINDTEADARRLVKMLRSVPCKINLLNYNENSFVAYKRTPERDVLKFQTILLQSGYTATYRRSRGRDIAAACGQLHHYSMRRGTVPNVGGVSASKVPSATASPAPVPAAAT